MSLDMLIKTLVVDWRVNTAIVGWLSDEDSSQSWQNMPSLNMLNSIAEINEHKTSNHKRSQDVLVTDYHIRDMSLELNWKKRCLA